MTMFNIESVRALIDNFEIVRKKNLLKSSRLEQLKSQFIHQFVLAGAWKFIKKRKYAEARQVMNLSKHPEMQQLRISPKWFPVKVTFSLYLWFSKLFPFATSAR